MPSKLRSLIGKCLQLDINKRPADINLVLEDIERIHDNISSNTPEEIVLAFVTGENLKKEVEELTEIDTQHHDLPIKRFIGVALIALALGIFGFYTLFIKSRKKDEIEKPVLASVLDSMVTVDQKSKRAKKTNVTKKAEKELISKKKSLPDSKKIKSAKFEKKTPSRKKKPAITKKEKTLSVKKAARKEISKDTKPQIIKDQNDANENARKIIDTMLKADATRNYGKVLSLYTSLPSQLARLKEARLLKLRALIGTNKTNKLYFDGNHINDCEFYLAKAKYLYNMGQYQQAAWILGIAKTTPALLIKKEVLNIEILYYLAKCKTNIYNGNQTPANKVTAMKSWFNVKNKFRNNQDHSYFHEANENIRELGKKE